MLHYRRTSKDVMIEYITSPTVTNGDVAKLFETLTDGNDLITATGSEAHPHVGR